jgi:ABC-2 type transport system ATP-binding protein
MPFDRYNSRMALAIHCRDLRKRYPSRTAPVDAVNGLNLEVQEGECFGLLGPNGAGKTTTIEILEGLMKPTSGDVEILGRRWGEDDLALRQRLGISLQETRLGEKLTVRETLALFRSFYGRGQSPETVMEQVGLTEKAQAYVGKLSGGQRQRLAVACALVGDPDLLFLDEPTTGLDPQSRRQLWDILRGFRAQGRTILLTTHYMDEAERLCDRVAVVDHGQVIALGSPAELVAKIGGDHLIEFALNDSLNEVAGISALLEPEDESFKGKVLDERAFQALPAVVSVRGQDDTYTLAVTAPHVTIPALLDLLQREGRDLARLTTRHASLEDVFVTLTGRHLRDEEPAA